MPIYDRPTRELMHDFAQNLEPNQVFVRNDAIDWFAEHYPRIRSTTVWMHVDGMSVNSRIRLHHPSIRADMGWDLFYKLSSSEFRLYDPQNDPAPRYKADFEADLAGSNAETTGDTAEEPAEEDDLGSRKFAFERDLQNYLAQNLGFLEPGLKLYEDEDGAFTGIEFPAGRRRIDILAVAADGAYVVIETKVSSAYDRVVGQILRYIGWVKANLAGEASVRGIIVASEISEDLILATSTIEGIQLVEYEISFSLNLVTGQ